MAKPVKHTPKHRLPVDRTAAPKRALRTSVVLGSIAAAATGLTVSAGMVSAAPGAGGDRAGVDRAGADRAGAGRAAASLTAASSVTTREAAPAADQETAAAVARDDQVSRSDRRAAADPAQEAVLDQQPGGAVAGRTRLADADPREIGRALLPVYGYGEEQWECLDRLFTSESNWRVNADNPTSSAYGIPQALTALHDLPADYMTNAETQIRWGLDYIQRRYGSPCSAWSFKRGHNWY